MSTIDWRPCNEEPPAVLFHGTSREFSTFDRRHLTSSSGHPSAILGHCFSAHPQIAESFFLEEEILDRAYEVLAGSKVLLDPGWPKRQAHRSPSGEPYRVGGRVIAVRIEPSCPASTSAREFSRMVDEGEAALWEALKAELRLAGHDALLIEGDPDAVEAGDLCVEYAADTWIALEDRIVSAVPMRRPAGDVIALARLRLATAPSP